MESSAGGQILCQLPSSSYYRRQAARYCRGLLLGWAI